MNDIYILCTICKKTSNQDRYVHTHTQLYTYTCIYAHTERERDDNNDECLIRAQRHALTSELIRVRHVIYDEDDDDNK